MSRRSTYLEKFKEAVTWCQKLAPESDKKIPVTISLLQEDNLSHPYVSLTLVPGNFKNGAVQTISHKITQQTQLYLTLVEKFH